MKYAAIGIAVVVGFVAVGVVVYRFARPRNDQRGGFRDWVKDPEYKRGVAEYFAARDALVVPEDISDAEIQRMVDRLFVREDEDFNFARLQLIGERVVPFLLDALGDPARATRRFGEGGHVLEAKTAFERICNLLEPMGPSEAAGPLARYLEHEDKDVRKEAALALGNIGADECIEPMVKALADENDFVRSYAVMGIRRGVSAGRCTQGFLDAMFPVVTKTLSDYRCSDTAPRLLLEIDTTRALGVLLSPEYFTIENGEVHHIIETLNEAGHKIPHERLLPLLKGVKPLADDYPYDYAYAEALKAYAHNPDGAAEETLRAEVTSTNERVQVGAAKALAILYGVTDADSAVFGALEQHGFEGLSQAQKYYYAVFIYNAEVNNGGHSQYFVNSSGEHWREAVAGLEAIGAEERARVLREAVALFGGGGPSVDHERRHEQLAGFSRRQDESLDALDQRYYACEENVRVLLALYTIEHKEHFGAGE